MAKIVMSRAVARAGLLGMAVGMMTLLPACQAWNSWLDLWKWKGHDQKPVMPGMAKGGRGLQSLPARMVVYKITLPVGTFSTNDKVWAQLNEDALDSKMNVLLAQNGLRAATGPVARFSQITKLIDVPGATTEQLTCETDGHSTVNVVTRAGVADQIVVSIDRDLQQQGRTFSRCDDGFRLSMRKTQVATKSGDPKPELVVQLEPVVTEGAGAGGVAKPGFSGLAMTNSSFTSEEGFSDLRMAATLGAGQFLVVSPQDPKGSRFSVGSLWLSDLDHVPAVETVLVFVPALRDTGETGHAPRSGVPASGRHL